MKKIRWLIKAAPMACAIVSIVTLFVFSWGDIQPQLASNFGFILNKYTGTFIFLLVCLYFIYVDFRHRNIPITVKNAEIMIFYEDIEGQSVKVRYKYEIRANHEDVDALFLYQNPSSCGQIPEESICASIRGSNYNARQDTILHQVSKKWEIIQSVSEPLPQELPLISYFRPRNLEYECEMMYLDCFKNKSYEHYDYTIKHRYAVKRLTFVLYVPEGLNLKECGLYEKNTASLKFDNVLQVSTSKQGYHKYLISKEIPSGRLSTYRLFWSS